MGKQAALQAKTKRISITDTYVVAIGASAGGLEAIHEFFDYMPINSNFSFVVIQHLSSDYKSLLVELVSKHTHMKVFEAENDMALHPDCVYIIPNNKLMTIRGGKLRLENKLDHKAPNTAIDFFLLTLAQDKKEKAVAIILSGTGTDGTRGIESIKEHGGMVIVQEPASAKFDGMPKSAITSGNADYILPPNLMHEQLFKYINEEPVTLLKDGRIDDALLDRIFKLVYQQSGNDFNLYKTPTIIRRISRRMTEVGIKKLDDYVKHVEKDATELRILGKDFLIGVTKFFRDKPSFECLAEKVMPQIIEAKQNNEVLKIWVCACSTGEEAYSIAILVNECMQKAGKTLDVKIFATDIDEASIDIASHNQYPSTITKEVPAAYLKKYFIKEGRNYSVIPSIRKQIVFAKHDVIKSPPFIKNDLVTCRNMLIYMNNLLQTKVLSTFHFSLNQGGFLFLGSSETAGPIRDGVIEINSKWKIYKKTGYINYLPGSNYQVTGSSRNSTALQKEPSPVSSLEKEFTETLLEDLGVVGLYIDRAYIIQEAIGNYKRFLTLPDKKIELNILKMVPRDAAAVLNSSIRKAWKKEENVQIKLFRIRQDDQDIFLNIMIKPPAKDSGKNLTLIIMDETMSDALTEKQEVFHPQVADVRQEEYVLQLEAELDETRGSLQMAVEEMETTNEELQSSNEELLSANEELQSSNEELQSLNEELHTLNTEHQLKIKELIDLNDDLDNYFRSIDVGLIFLDANLTIRKFNQAAINIVNLINADVGRSIEQITNNFKDEALINDIRSVVVTNKAIEKELLLKNSTRTLMRIMPYVRRDKKADGVVISFVDISLVTELNNIISGVFNASVSAVLAFTPVLNQEGNIVDFRCVAANKQAEVIFKREGKELTEVLLVRQLPEIAEGSLFNKYVQVAQKGTTLQMEMLLEKDVWYQVVAVKMGDGFAITFTNINARKQAEQKLKKNYNDLIATRENLKDLNAELENKVRERTTELARYNERFSLILKASNDTIWDWDLVNNTMWRSENFTSMFGYHLDDESQSVNFWFSKIHAGDRDAVRKSVYDAINNSKKQWSAEYRFQKADGSYSVILDRGTIQQDDYGTPYRMVGSIVDITRLVEAERKVNVSESKFKRIFESNLIGMFFSDSRSDIIQTANQAFLDMLGYTTEDLETGGISRSKIIPDEYVETSHKATKIVKRDGYCSPFEIEYIHKDGHRISVLIGSALLSEHEGDEIITYVIDTTRQKEEEQKRQELRRLISKQQDEFYSIFKSAPALITIRRGPDLRYRFVNDAVLKFDGNKEYIDRPFFDVHPELKDSDLAKADQLVLKTGETQTLHALRVPRIDPETGEQVISWFDCIFTPVYTEDGNIDGIAFFGFDVTDLLAAQEATKDLMRKKDEFMSIASHELKTPITTIKGSLQMLSKLMKRSNEEPNVTMLMDKAAKQTTKLTALVDDLLDVTKIHSGKLQLTKSKFSMNELIHECVDQLQPSLSKHNIIVKAPKDVVVTADRNRIEQVIFNFLSNAAKYSPDQKDIIISSETDGKNVRITVKDQGIGIPDDKKAYVFDRFFRVQESSTRFSGLGLGLYISSEIISRHNGEIGLDSKENEGSEFWFTLPL